MMKALPLTPLMTISLTLTIGIIIAKWGYDDFNMRFWLIISIISCALSSIIFFLTKFLSKKSLLQQEPPVSHLLPMRDDSFMHSEPWGFSYLQANS